MTSNIFAPFQSPPVSFTDQLYDQIGISIFASDLI